MQLVSRLQTSGINPYFRSSESIADEIRNQIFPVCSSVDEVFFYGAGITNISKEEVVHRAFCQLWPGIKGHYFSDLLGAARAVYGSQPGVICILGTGSNAGYFNGQQLIDRCSPLGFVLGDEGSGAVLGRDLVADFFKQIMPADLREKFRHNYPVTEQQVLDKVYHGERPNRYLAGFCRFLSANAEHPYCREFLYTRFLAFVKRNVMQLDFPKDLPVSFVGSIAFYFRDILQSVVADQGLVCGEIVLGPIEGLAAFHAIKLS